MRAGSPSSIIANAAEKGSAMPMQPVHTDRNHYDGQHEQI